MRLAKKLVLSTAIVFLASVYELRGGDLRLIEGVKRSDEKAVQALVAAHVPVNAAEADGMTALHWAAQNDQTEIVNLLLRAGADAKAATRFGITPLQLAANNGNARMIEALIKAGAEVNRPGQEG